MRVVFNLKYFQAGRIGGQEGVIRGMAAGLAAAPLAPRQRMYALCAAGEREAVAGMCDWVGIATVALEDGERAMARALGRLRPDLYLCPMTFIEPADPPCPTVALIPDLQHETYPELFAAEELAQRRRNYGAAVHRADLILTPSHYARQTILDRYPDTGPERVAVVYPSLDPAFSARASSVGIDLPADYLLYPANFWTHKNHSRLLQALAQLRRSDLSPPLILTGDPASGFDRVEREIARLGLEGQVRFLGRLPTEEFAALLRGARSMVFPSLYEGVGLPILEAFHCETAVLCSRVASCPEVAGEAALLVDPKSVDDLATALRRIWTDAQLRDALIEKGRLRRRELEAAQPVEQLRSALLSVAGSPQASPRGLATLLRRWGLGSLTP